MKNKEQNRSSERSGSLQEQRSQKNLQQQQPVSNNRSSQQQQRTSSQQKEGKHSNPERSRNNQGTLGTP